MSMFEIVWTPKPLKKLVKLTSNTQKKILKKVERYAGDPESLKNNVKYFSDRKVYRLRVDDWRVIFRKNKKAMEILIIQLDSREGVYKK